MGSSETAKPQQGRLFQKTKMCFFHMQGRCERDQDCVFAHDCSELRPLPDLSRTKLCKALANTGVCDDPACTFAHSWSERRRYKQTKLARQPNEKSVRRNPTTQKLTPPMKQTGLAGGPAVLAGFEEALAIEAWQTMPPSLAALEPPTPPLILSATPTARPPPTLLALSQGPVTLRSQPPTGEAPAAASLVPIGDFAAVLEEMQLGHYDEAFQMFERKQVGDLAEAFQMLGKGQDWSQQGEAPVLYQAILDVLAGMPDAGLGSEAAAVHAGAAGPLRVNTSATPPAAAKFGLDVVGTDVEFMPWKVDLDSGRGLAVITIAA